MAQTKLKSRPGTAQSKAPVRSEASVTEFADPKDAPEAQTVAELKKAAGKTTADSTTKKAPKKPAQAQEWSLAERLRLKWGMAGVKTLSVLIRATLFAMVVLVVWIGAITIASGLVPGLAQLVSDGTGVTFESRLDQVIMGLLLPTVFLNGLLFVLVCVVVKKLWVFHVRLGTRARNVLLGENG